VVTQQLPATQARAVPPQQKSALLTGQTTLLVVHSLPVVPVVGLGTHRPVLDSPVVVTQMGRLVAPVPNSVTHWASLVQAPHVWVVVPHTCPSVPTVPVHSLVVWQVPVTQRLFEQI